MGIRGFTHIRRMIMKTPTLFSILLLTLATPLFAQSTLPADPTVWPNKFSSRNSDPWLVENHSRIRKMQPRVLILNFANDVDMPAVQSHTEKLINALAEATRYHGYENPNAPAFLQYQVLKYIDLRDNPIPQDLAHKSSSLFPRQSNPPKDFYCDYSVFYTDDFARHYGFPDPKNPARFLNLHQLINAGIVHELWFHAIHGPDGWPGFEVIETKQYYDENCQPIPNTHGWAGNGHSDTMPWSGRTFRMAFFNPHRGIGCAMENFGHGLEGIANSNSIAYYRKYFNEYAELDFNTRHELPFKSLYAIGGRADKVEYPSSTSMKISRQGKTYTINPYIALGGNVHFPPGGRHHYDLDSPFTVKSTIENYRRRNAPDGKDIALDFNRSKFTPYNDLAPDGMGPWVVFWRQCMPGLDNKSLDDSGKPMKNWWVFLFY